MAETETPQPTAAVAQSRESGGIGLPSGCGCADDSSGQPPFRYPGEGTRYEVDAAVTRPSRMCIYERKVDEPVYRTLRIYTQDATASRLDGAVARVNVPYEPLLPGPKGCLFEVDHRDVKTGTEYRVFDPNDPFTLMGEGRNPSPSDPRFHQQMVYAVASNVYAVFRHALGRTPTWGFDAPESADGTRDRCIRLRLYPHGDTIANAYYCKEKRGIFFGHYLASEGGSVRSQRGAQVFTALTHDIIVHEVSHALLDGLRAHFDMRDHPDVPAFHEAFSDLVAIFQRFTHEEVVALAVRRSQGRLQSAVILTDLAREFGNTTGKGGALRTVVDSGQAYDPVLPGHKLGSVLASAAFEAFITVFNRKTVRYMRLATGGTAQLPSGEPPVDLQILLAKEAKQLASQFLTMCVRAIDYCPPVGLTFGEFLRAVITADRDLVPDDVWCYREAWIDAFQKRGIYVNNVQSLAEDALVWSAPDRHLDRIPELTFARLQFRGDPGLSPDAAELRRQAAVLAEVMTKAANLKTFGLTSKDNPALGGDRIDLPVIQSIRATRRVGPDGQVAFELVAEVTQKREVLARDNAPGFDYFGGSTVILNAKGEVRYVIRKSVLSSTRLEEQRRFMASEAGGRYWEIVESDRGKKLSRFRLHEY